MGTARAVSIHSAGLPAEKRAWLRQPELAHEVSIHSAGLPAEKQRARVGIHRGLRVSIHSAGLPAEKRYGSSVLWITRRVSIHSAGLPAEKLASAPARQHAGQVSIHSAGLPAEKRAHTRALLGRNLFQSTPLVFQRRNASLTRIRGRDKGFNPLRWSSSGETRVLGGVGLVAHVSIHSAGLPAEKRLA